MEIIGKLSSYLMQLSLIFRISRQPSAVTMYIRDRDLRRKHNFTNALSRTSLTQRVPRHDLVITAIINQKSFGPINSKRFYSGYFVLVATHGGPLPLAAPMGSRPFRIIALFIVPNQSADISIYANREFLDPFFF